jgi:hypothetical protein
MMEYSWIRGRNIGPPPTNALMNATAAQEVLVHDTVSDVDPTSGRVAEGSSTGVVFIPRQLTDGRTLSIFGEKSL